MNEEVKILSLSTFRLNLMKNLGEHWGTNAYLKWHSVKFNSICQFSFYKKRSALRCLQRKRLIDDFLFGGILRNQKKLLRIFLLTEKSFCISKEKSWIFWQLTRWGIISSILMSFIHYMIVKWHVCHHIHMKNRLKITKKNINFFSNLFIDLKKHFWWRWPCQAWL